jgi:hypothetical protein
VIENEARSPESKPQYWEERENEREKEKNNSFLLENIIKNT